MVTGASVKRIVSLQSYCQAYQQARPLRVEIVGRKHEPCRRCPTRVDPADALHEERVERPPMFPPTFLYTQSWEDPEPDMEVSGSA